MKKSLLAVLNDAERMLVAETEPAALRGLDEDAVVDLHTRVRRARNKYVGQYRRGAATRVAEQGGRGKARPKNQRASAKAEAFEIALARVSTRLGELAAAAADELRAERLAAAAAAKSGQKPKAAPDGSPKSPAPGGKVLDRAPRTPVKAKQRATAKASGARRQAKRDAR